MNNENLASNNHQELICHAREIGVQSEVESYQNLKKWYLMSPCLILRIIRRRSRVKWSNPGKGVSPSLHLGVVAIEKRAFGSDRLQASFVSSHTEEL